MRNREEENVVNLTGIVGADGQVRIFPDEGLPDDYEDARYKQTKEFFLKASAEEVEANDEKKRATSIFKTKERQLHYAEVKEIVERARLESIKRRGEYYVAVDHLDFPQVIRGRAMKKMRLDGTVFYAAFFEGMEVELSHARDLDAEDEDGEKSEEGEGAA